MQNSELEYSVLVVDDDEDTRYAIAKMLDKCGCKITEVGSVEEALIVLSERHFDMIFTDMRFNGGMDGDALLETVGRQHPGVEVVVMSCSMDVERKAKLMNKGAARCLEKPFYYDTCAETLATLDNKFDQKAA